MFFLSFVCLWLSVVFWGFCFVCLLLVFFFGFFFLGGGAFSNIVTVFVFVVTFLPYTTLEDVVGSNWS